MSGLQQQVVINGKALTISKASENDLEEICTLMELVHRNMDDKSMFVCDDKSFVEKCIKNEGFVIIVRAEHCQLVGSFIFRYPGNAEDNLGHDIGLSEDELCKVVHMESSVVHPEYRGYGLQRKMLEYGEVIIDATMYKYYMATVSPDNRYSLNNLLYMGYSVVVTKEKYRGLIRNILLKKK